MSIFYSSAKTEFGRGLVPFSFVPVRPLAIGLAALVLSCFRVTGAEANSVSGTTFPTADAAVTALKDAVLARDTDALKAIFGPAALEFENPDRVQATNEMNAFSTAIVETNRIIWESPGKGALEVGRDFWPFPIPLVKHADGWSFDTQAGKEELLNRRVGRNELKTLAVVRSYVEAQREYARVPRNEDEILEYAQKLLSTPGKKDGLYWSPDLDGEISPLGPLVANAQNEGYQPGQSRPPEPYYGYYFKILKRQASHAPIGKYDYVINGHMIAGFALVAWPARWGQSGVMTFIVNQQGRVYQKNLGPDTFRLGGSMKVYDPDPSWTLSLD
jgi:Protein of unknown function (DUF2950)